MFGSNRRILITGANGLLGQLLSRHLDQKWFKVFGLDCIPENKLSRRFEQEKNNKEGTVFNLPFPGKYFVADITNQLELQNVIDQIGQIDILLHLAAALEDQDVNVIEKVNVEGTKNIYELCRKNNINRVIFASSITVLWDRYCNEEPYCSIQKGSYSGKDYEIPKIKPELILTLPLQQVETPQFTAYIKSKIQGEWIAKEYAEKYNIKTIMARFGTITTRQNDEYNLEPRRASVLCGWDTARALIEELLQELLKDFYKATAEPIFIINPRAKKLWVEPAIQKKIASKEIQSIEEALEDSNQFKQLINTADDLCLYAQLVPIYANALIEYVLKDEGEFKRLFINKPVFTSVFRVFPNYKYLLIEYVLKRPDEFKRLYEDANLREEALFYPKYAKIFNQPTIEAAIDSAQQYFEIKKVTRTLSALSKGLHKDYSRFSSLPADLLIKIASHLTMFSTVYSREDGERIAKDSFIEPPKFNNRSN